MKKAFLAQIRQEFPGASRMVLSTTRARAVQEERTAPEAARPLGSPANGAGVVRRPERACDAPSGQRAR